MREPDSSAGQGSTTGSGAAGQGGSGGSTSKPKQAVGQAKETARQVKDQVQERTAPVADKAQETVSQAAEQAGQMATSRLESQKERLAGGLDQVARAVRQTGRELREEQPTVAQYADTVAEKMEHLGDYVRQREVGQLMDEAERFGRRQPTVLLGGGFALGLLLARFLKSSSQRARPTGGAYQSSFQQASSGSTPYGGPAYQSQTQPYGTGMRGSGTYGAGTYGTGAAGIPETGAYRGAAAGTADYSPPVERSELDRTGGQQTSTDSDTASGIPTSPDRGSTPSTGPASRSAGGTRSGDAPARGE